MWNLRYFSFDTAPFFFHSNPYRIWIEDFYKAAKGEVGRGRLITLLAILLIKLSVALPTSPLGIL